MNKTRTQIFWIFLVTLSTYSFSMANAQYFKPIQSAAKVKGPCHVADSSLIARAKKCARDKVPSSYTETGRWKVQVNVIGYPSCWYKEAFAEGTFVQLF